MRQIGKALAGSETAISELSTLLKDGPEIRSSYEILSAKIQRFSERLSEAYETMSLGLTAEALVHEISVIADGLAERVADLKNILDNPSRVEARTKAFVRHVDTSIAGLRPSEIARYPEPGDSLETARGPDGALGRSSSCGGTEA